MAKLCIKVDCSEMHDALYHNKKIDFETIDASKASVFLTRFFPVDQPMAPWHRYSVLVLVRQDLLAWTLGAYHGHNPHEPKGEVGESVYFNETLVRKTAQQKVIRWLVNE